MKKKKDVRLVVCKACNWIAFPVSREFAESEVFKFNEYFKTLTKKQQKDYYGGKGASIKLYDHCFFCDGSYVNFKDANKADEKRAFGHTLNPIINRKD